MTTSLLGDTKAVPVSNFNEIGDSVVPIFVVANDVENAPFSGVMRGHLVSKKYSGYGMQIYIDSNNATYKGKIFIRTLRSEEWTSWREV